MTREQYIEYIGRMLGSLGDVQLRKVYLFVHVLFVGRESDVTDNIG